MTLSISAIAGSPASTAPRTTASTGIFALSLAQLTAAPVAGSDADASPTGDPTAKNDDDKRQDDAADGNALPLPTSLVPDPSLLAALLVPPVPVAAPVLPVGDTATGAGPPGVDAVAVAAAISGDGTGTGAIVAPTSPAAAVADSAPPTVTDAPAETVPVAAASSAAPPIPIPAAASLPDPTITTLPAGSSVVDALPSPAVAAAPLPAALPVAPSTMTPTTLVATPAPAQPTPIPPPSAVAAAMPIVALVAPVATTGVATDAPPPATVTTVPTSPPVAGTIQIDTRSAPVVALPPAAPPPLQGSATTTSAIQAFGSAMRAGLARDPRLDTGTDGTAGTIAGGRTTHTDQTPAVAATGDAQQAPLDLRREQWPHAMIDRIEALRDAADATSTKIRVVPDALGPVEMSVRRDGDTLHVHFTADQAATRAILTDAQPHLAAIAEQRGLRLGGSTVDGGSTNAGAGQQQQQQAATRQPNAPPPSFPSTTATAADDDDTRIA